MKKFIQALVYFSILPFIYLISILPFFVLYFLSDILNLFLSKIFKYRKKVIIENLRNSFPEKNRMELEEISANFYEFLCDLIFETIKLATMSKKDILERCPFDNIEVFNNLFHKNKSIIVVMGHYGNWEWANASMSLSSSYQLNAIYKPLSNPFFDNFFLKVRSRFGTKMVSMNNVLRAFVELKSKLTTTAFLADQTAGPGHSFWITFLNQETTVFPGPEKLAKKYNYPVVFCYVDRYKRGYYKIYSEVLFLNPKETKEGEISLLHTKTLEKLIIKKPALWLWSHRKWKHKREI